jgi:serine/threonine protein kinase
MADFLVLRKEQISSMKRKLTPKTMTRWYRAPEVCFAEKVYHKAIDIWSLGVVLTELIYCSTPYVNQDGFDSSNRYMFNGDSSYPLSPSDKNTQKIVVSSYD